MLRVFNVGQADSIELQPVIGCAFEKTSILVDCGQGHRNVFESLANRSIILLLSHSHEDHIGGMSRLFAQNDNLKIKELWLPLFSDEIAKISQFILSLKGVQAVRGKTVFEPYLKNIIQTHRLLKSILKPFGCENIRGIRSGMKLCNHLSVLNPVPDADESLGLPHGTAESYWNKQKNSDFETIRNWLTKDDFSKLRNNFITEGWDSSLPNLIQFKDNQNDFNLRMEFIFGFFHKYERQFDNFVKSGAPKDFNHLGQAIISTANDVSVVTEYRAGNFSCLLTGDIGKKAWEKAQMRSQGGSINIVKFPHHGSKKSLSRSVLLKLEPKLVIISHNNGIFGKQKDPHPHKEVIQTLDRMNTKVAYTNPVMKDGFEIKPKSDPYPYPDVEVVELHD